MNRLAELLRKKSENLNLFSAGDRLKLDEKHIPDALAVLSFWRVKAGFKAADIGTGGGLPGLALALERPDIEWVLIDSTAKKIRAVKEMVAELGLKNVEVLCGRAEELAHQKNWREHFDVVTARAVAKLPTLLEYAAGFLKVGGKFYAWKSREHEEELNASKKAQARLHLEWRETLNYTLPAGEQRSILCFEKMK